MCPSPISVRLVLVSQEPIHWILRPPAEDYPGYSLYEDEHYEGYGHHNDINVNLVDVSVSDFLSLGTFH